MTTMVGPTKSEITEALAHLSRRAAREFPVVGTTDQPTPLGPAPSGHQQDAG